MRIRRNASKLLGSATVYNANPCPSPATAAVSSAETEVLMICELNRSPWDLLPIDPDDPSCCNDDFFANPKEEEEEDGGILGNFIRTEEDEEPISAITSTAAELTLKEMKKIEKKVEIRKKSRGMENLAADINNIVYCKKSDGKGWHCKRPAQLPQSFCSYHLAQIRSYSSSQRATCAAATESSDNKGKNHRKAGVPAVSGDPNFYYYYSGFGPWRGKRRGQAAAVVDQLVAIKEEAREVSSSCSGMEHSREDNDHTAVHVAGDDEYDLDYFDDDDEEDVDDDNSFNSNNSNGKRQEKLEKKRPAKKRGRKPMKSRSLKSLL